MSEYPDAIDCFVDRSRVFQNQNSHSAIVIHGTGGSAGQTATQLGQFFATTPAETSVHYGIDRSGIIAQYVLEQDGAGGSCCVEGNYDPFWDQFPDNKNLHILCVETVNDVNNSLALTDPQKATLFKLIAYWVDKYNIPLSNIKGHFSLDPVNRARCPGPNFAWDELFAYLKGSTPMIPAGWSDNGTALTAPNGHKVVQGFRDYILGSGWDPNNVPLEEAIAANPVEDYYQSGNGTRQLFNYCELAWTQARGVYVVGIGNELRGARAKIVALQAQIATLQKQPGLANLQQINALAAQAGATLVKIGTLSQVH